MRFQLGVTIALAALSCGMYSAAANAAFDLRVTEIWAGQPGDDITNDWFEITNYGDMAWISGVDLDLQANDSSGGFGTSVLIQGISDILPGESVIVLMEGVVDPDMMIDDVQRFYDAWNPVKPQVLANIGYADGGGLGLGQPGPDGIDLFLADMTPLDSEDYPAFDSPVSWDVALGAFSTVGNGSGAVASFALGGDDQDTPAIASPGMVVPEPASLAMVAVGIVLFALRRYRT